MCTASAHAERSMVRDRIANRQFDRLCHLQKWERSRDQTEQTRCRMLCLLQCFRGRVAFSCSKAMARSTALITAASALAKLVAVPLRCRRWLILTVQSHLPGASVDSEMRYVRPWYCMQNFRVARLIPSRHRDKPSEPRELVRVQSTLDSLGRHMMPSPTALH